MAKGGISGDIYLYPGPTADNPVSHNDAYKPSNTRVMFTISHVSLMKYLVLDY